MQDESFDCLVRSIAHRMQVLAWCANPESDYPTFQRVNRSPCLARSSRRSNSFCHRSLVQMREDGYKGSQPSTRYTSEASGIGEGDG